MAIPPNKTLRLPAAGRHATMLAILGVAGCSTLPEREWPPRVVGDLEVEYRLGRDLDRAIQMPESDARLTLLELHTHTDGIREEFRGGHRYWVVPVGIDTLRVHCRYRAFGERGADAIASAVDPDQLFPGATVIRHEARSDGTAGR